MGMGMTGGDPTRVTGRRVVGYVFDSVIDAIVLATLLAVLSVKATPSPVGTLRPSEGQEVSGLALAVLLFFAYYLITRVAMLGVFGATPGMFITAIRCVRWDGRPCGIWRALVRTVIMGIGSYVLSWLFLVLAYFTMHNSKGHKSLNDMVAGTYVIDSIYSGRLIIETIDGLMAGPPSVKREEAEAYLRAEAEKQGLPPGFVPPIGANVKSGEPILDKNLDTYVVWNKKQNQWLAFDKQTGSWNVMG